MLEASDFSPCGTITLTTDFGHKGPFVGTMKGQMLTRFPAANIVDLTHDIVVHWPAEAGFWIQRGFRYFPTGTVHVAVVDPGVGTDRNIIAVEAAGHLFLAPDNGLLAPVADETPNARVYQLDFKHLEQFGIHTPSVTFHGRDILAPLAALLAGGRLVPADLGPQTSNWVPSWLEPAEKHGDRTHGIVVAVDHFGNLISNIDAGLVPDDDGFYVSAGGHYIVARRTYGDVAPGAFLALINSFKVVEIACAEKNASDELGIGRGAPVVVIPGQPDSDHRDA